MTALPGPLRLYRLATGLAEPFAPGLLRRRARRGKEDPARLGERLGRASQPRPDGKLIWIHAASVGESLSHLPLVERFIRDRPDLHLLVTSGTRTSAELLARRLPAGVIHQFVPIDAPRAVRRFLDHWRPSLGLLIESELWPNLLFSARAHGVRLVLLGARISQKSARAWDRSPAAARAMLGLFDLIYAQDDETRDWIQDQGAEVTGKLDLKRAAGPLPHDAAALDGLKKALDGRLVVVAASTHPGEEIMIAEAVRSLEPRPLLILVPRHPERGPVVELALNARGWRVARRARGDAANADMDAYVADTLGELGLFYRVADVVVVGGSLLEGLAGHNPLEPARLAKPVIAGPHVDAFAEVYAELVGRKAALMVKDDVELVSALRALLSEPRVARVLGRRGREVCDAGRANFDEAWTSLEILCPPP